MGMGSTTAPLRRGLARALPERPFEVHFWDGSALPATASDGVVPVFSVRSPNAVAHALSAPGQLGLSRAYVSGELAVDDLDAVLDVLREWQPPPIGAVTRGRLLLAATRAAGLMRPPPRPAVELRPRGRRHSLARDARAVRHHYDVSAEFFALFLGESMTYSCAVFEDPSGDTEPLEDAQERKLEMVCRKLALQPGERVLDVGCGWGSFPVHAATHHGARVVGITLSDPQARRARERAAAAGVSTASRSASPTTASCAASASTRSRASAWSSTSASATSTSTPASSPACWTPAGGS